MLSRPSGRTVLGRACVRGGLVSSSAAELAVRRLATSPALSLRHRVVPETLKFPKSERHDPYTVRQLEDLEITKQLTEAAGTTTKERIGRGIDSQTEYFTKQVFRMDKEEATKAVLEGLPPLTEMDIDDFYLNLMASGNELGNLPALASPNRTAADAHARRENELAYESEDQRNTRIAADQHTRAIRERMRARQHALLDALRVQDGHQASTLHAPSQASAIDAPQQQVEHEHENVLVGVATSDEQRAPQARRLRMSSSGLMEEVPQADPPLPSYHHQPYLAAESARDTPPHHTSQPESIPPSSSPPPPSPSSSPAPASAVGQSFEQRYPHATRLSSSPAPSSSTTSPPLPTPSSSTSPSVSTPRSDATHQDLGSLGRVSPVEPSTAAVPASTPRLSAFASRSRRTSSDGAVASSSSPPSPSPPAVPAPSAAPPPPVATFVGQNIARLRVSSPALQPIVPRPNPLIVKLEEAVVRAEAARASSPSGRSSYLHLPPAPDMGPPSPIQAVQPTDSNGRPVGPRAFPTAFPAGVDSRPAHLVYDAEGKVKLAVPPLADAPRPPPKPTVLPMGLMTHGEWKAVVYQSLDEPAKLRAQREKQIDDKWAARGPSWAATREKFKLKERLRHERNDKVGKIRIRNADEKVQAMQQAGYALQAAKVLELMQRSGGKPGLKWFLDVLASLAECGDVRGVQQVITQSERAGHPANYETYSYLVDAHLSNNDKHNALATLHDLESRSLYALERSYRGLIRTLVNSDVHSERATGWDLVAHMRLVAHPIPSKETYDVIIEACANTILPEPERALDLWTEMTIDNQIQPDVRSFNAIIKAVGAVRKFYLEAFRLMRQMLDFYHTAMPDSAQRAMYTPDRDTFENLLVGAKKNGDIARTRWILTEMIRFSNHPGMRDNGADISPTVHTMKSVFQAYTAAKPTIHRDRLAERDAKEAIGPPKDEHDSPTQRVTDGRVHVTEPASEKLIEEEQEEQDDEDDFDETKMTVEYGHSREGAEEDEMDAEWGTMDSHSFQHSLNQGHTDSSLSSSTADGLHGSGPAGEEAASPAPAQGPNVQQAPLPQSSSEIIHEARRLLAHAADDSRIFHDDPSQRTPAGNLPSLRHVLVDTSLVNAFMYVHYFHTDDYRGWIDAFATTYDDHRVRKDARSYVALFDALRKRIGANHRHERAEHRNERAEELYKVFQEWERFEAHSEAYLQRRLDDGVDPREVWAQRRAIGLEPRVVEQIWVRSIEIMTLAGQLSIAMSMMERFYKLYPPEAILRSNLPPLPSKALVRMVPRSSIRPDPLPPHLLFPDLNLLHAAQVVLQQAKPIGKIKHITSRYADAIHRARKAKLNEGDEGKTRESENVLDRSLRKIAFEEAKKSGNYQQNEGKKAGAGLSRFEGGYGIRPDDLKLGKTERKISAVWGKDALDRYLRAKRQF